MRGFAKLFAALLVIVSSVAFANAYEVKSFEGRFSIDFPGAPAADTIQDVGSCVATRHEYRFKERGRVWTASYQDCKPAGMVADLGHMMILKDAIRGLLKATKGELRAQHPVEVGVLQGREIVVAVPGNLILRERFFIEGDRIYQLMYVGPFGTQDEPAVDAFFASFRVMR
jgi:hypothetical protein